jgi:tetratricopeptide (TPR) repeat protein
MCDQIKQVYIEALGVKPSGIEAIVAIGKCELELHDFDEALFRFRAALKLAPRNEAALAGIAEAFTGMGKKDRAVTAWNDYLDVFPRSTKAINRLDRLAATPVVKPEPTPPAEPAKPEEAVKPAGPTAVPPAALEANRIAGTKEILPDEATETEIERSGKTRLVASLKLCVSDTGAIQSVTLLKPTGFAAYDAKLQDQIKTWRYRPFLVDGKPAAVCTAVTFVYSQR